ncbi:MAG: shufflon system plasmid conjugative transfer pilus tip adhesin PilV [Alphaproteobacteria bacterium]|nr:shufflon system plasmid conjugative transfer pilus tip adhesin PilV [Alphaproteobacteria bacterium]
MTDQWRGRPAARRRRGLTLFGSLLALALVGVMAAGLFTIAERHLADMRERRAAAGIVLLTRAAHHHVTDRFAGFLAGPEFREVTLAELQATGELQAGIPAGDAMGRGRRILVRTDGTSAIDVVVTQVVAAGDRSWPWRAAASTASGIGHLGTVAPGSSRLTGPTIDVDVSAFQGVFQGAPAPWALAAHLRLDRHAIFGDQLWRIEVDGFPEINRMETDLDMAGHDITNAGDIATRTLAVADTLEIGGDLDVTGALVVGELVEIAGTGRFSGEVSAPLATVTGEVNARTVTATGEVSADTLDIDGAVRAGAIATSGTLAVTAEASVGTLTSTSVAAGSVTADTVAATAIDAHQVTVSGSIESGSAGISVLTVGRCSGC